MMKNNEKIWQIVHSIPYGKVATYGQVARLAELPGYARYVGFVMKSLPAGSKLPWHRVVNSQGQLSFPTTSKQYQLQKSRLQNEGVKFNQERLSLATFGWKP